MPEDDDLPRLLSGRYRLEATLGHGGMGVVYRGLDLMMKRPIAVKLIRAVDGVELDDEIAGRFLREAKNTARLQHEHIIEVFDLGRSDEGGMYFVMELLEGESLSARLRREGALSPQTTVHIGRQICEALQVAHMVGIIHRDLKPANVMLLSRAGDDDYVKVLDFGVAKSYAPDQETQLTQTGMLVGTVDYMAPEQIMGKTVDGRTDVYALGVVLYKMLAGKAPFRDNGVPALIHAHLNTMPKPLIEVTKTVPNDLDRVVLRCLAKSPDRRYESMAELARALVAAITPDSVPGLVSLEYGNSSKDPYDADDKTAIGRSFADQPLAADDATFKAGARSFDKPSPRPTPVPPQRPVAGARTNPTPIPPPPPPAPKPAQRSSEPPPQQRRSYSDPLPADDATYNENVGMFDDATLKMDRPLDLKKPPGQRAGGSGSSSLPMTPRSPGTSRQQHGLRQVGGPPPNAPIDLPRLAKSGESMVYGEDISTAKRTVPDEITRIDRAEQKICAMCQTVNAPHSRACLACGISLASPDQEAVRVRVRTGGGMPTPMPPPPLLGGNANPSPRTVSSSAPHMGPPISGAYDMASGMHRPPSNPPPPHPSGGAYGQPTPSHGMPAMGWLPHQPPPPSPPQSMWQRFLRWTRGH